VTARPTHPKSTCCIPGCPRWSRRYPSEWLCGRHWRIVPARLRRALRKAWRALRDAYSRWQGNTATKDVWRLTMRLQRVERRLWGHAKRRVIMFEAGL
jgi:hypothetical protein